MDQMSVSFPVPYIMHADDDADEHAFLIEMMRRVDPAITIVPSMDGLELMQQLENLPTGHPLPCCIVLDLNMPLWNGMRTLQAIKAHSSYHKIPVFILTTSTSERDARVARDNGVKDFIKKPYNQQELFAVCEELAVYADTPVQDKKAPCIRQSIRAAAATNTLGSTVKKR